MSSPAGEVFPSPVGGAPLSVDFAPSVVFVVLYGLLAPLILYRAFSPASRTTLLIATASFALGRVADFSLRTAEAHETGGGVNKEILTYLQTTYAIGFISMGQTLLGLTRCLLVNALKGESARTDEELQQITPRSDGASDRPSTKPDDVPVNPEVAYRSRVLWAGGFILQAHYFAVIGLGAVAGGIYYDAITQSGKAREVQVLRYLAAGMALVLLQLTGLAAIVGAYVDRNVSRRKTLFIVVNILLLSTVAVYRLVVMRFQTDALDSTAPGSLNDSGSKATFYIFHVVPEMLSVVLIFGFNVREMFETGPFGRGR